MGLLARTVAHHGIDRIAPVLRIAGIDTLFPEALPTTHRDKAKAIAALLGTTPDEVKLRCHQPVDVPGRPNSFMNFFGTPIREHYREARRRRFSPASLATSPHHRALWDLKVFSFCPESRETLIAACPHCDAKLGWRWTVGIAFCEHCGEDLRDASTSQVECVDWEALDFVVDLIHPDPARRTRAHRSLPHPLSGLDNGEAFEACMALACASTFASDAPEKRLVRSTGFAAVTPDALAWGGRTILEWPTSFQAWTGVAGMARPDHGILKRRLGMLARLFADPYLASSFRQGMRQELGIDVVRYGLKLRRPYVRGSSDGRHVGAGSRVQRSGAADRSFPHGASIPVRSAAKAPVVRRAKIGRNTIAKQLGVDCLTVARLAHAGLFSRVDAAAAWAKAGEAYDRVSVDAFVTRARGAVLGSPESIGAVPLAVAARRVPAATVPWVGIFRAILDRSIEVYPRDGRGDAALTSALNVVEWQLRDLVASLPQEFVLTPRGEYVSVKEAAAMVGVTVSIVQLMVEEELLPSDPATRRLRTADVIAFHSAFMLSGEVARLLGYFGSIRQVLFHQDLSPATTLRDGEIAVWRREQVEAAIGPARQRCA